MVNNIFKLMCYFFVLHLIHSHYANVVADEQWIDKTAGLSGVVWKYKKNMLAH